MHFFALTRMELRTLAIALLLAVMLLGAWVWW
jgi:hypothetical protein